MTADLFERKARRLARQRALRLGDPYLLEGTFDDLIERLATIDRPKQELLLIGALDPAWPARLSAFGANVTIVEPAIDDDEDRASFPLARYDAIVACGSLDTVNDLPLALHSLTRSLKPDAPLIGACFGGNNLPLLRRSLIAADRFARDGGAVWPRTHPRIDASSFSALLGNAGLMMPVIDVQRFDIRYSSLDRLVADLRASGASNVLRARSRLNPGRTWRSQVAEEFMRGRVGGKVVETVEVLHFLAWSPASRS